MGKATIEEDDSRSFQVGQRSRSLEENFGDVKNSINLFPQ
jgi:hypothetical protein